VLTLRPATARFAVFIITTIAERHRQFLEKKEGRFWRVGYSQW
jgi:hypothetical protein